MAFEGIYSKDQLSRVSIDLEKWAGGDVVKVIAKPIANRKLSLLALYWAGWVGPITDWENKYNDRGWSREDTHRYLKTQFFIEVDRFEELLQNFKEGEIQTLELVFELSKIIDEATTTTFDDADFSKKLNEIRKFYANEGLELRSINEPPLLDYN